VLIVRYSYKIDPSRRPHPAYPNALSWSPVLNVRLSNPAKPQSAPTKLIEVLIDSGSAATLFNSNIGVALGLDIASGIYTQGQGLFKRAKSVIYFHEIDLHVDTSIIRIAAGFCDDLRAGAGVLGRWGFFEYFIVTFDPTFTPPGFELERVGRA